MPIPSDITPGGGEDTENDPLMGNSITGLFEGAMEQTDWSHQETSWEPPDDDELKRLFPAHEVQCLLGRGGMGVVYKAYDLVLQKTVAIKLLPQALAENSQLMSRFKREAHVMNALDHPGIVKVHSFVQTPDGHAYFIMDYVEGKTIHELVAAKEISVRKTLRLVVQVCKALHYLHGKGVIHRDIKPSNIIVDLHGNARLLDFGIAGQMPGGTENLTLTGQNPGTPFYMAPELQRGEPPTASSDIYSLGVTFYEMLTGERPPVQPPPPSSRSSANSSVDRVVFRALKPMPNARYHDADEMRKAIEGCSRAAREFRMALILAAVLVPATLAIIAWVVVPKGSAGSDETTTLVMGSLSGPTPAARPAEPETEAQPSAELSGTPPSESAEVHEQGPEITLRLDDPQSEVVVPSPTTPALPTPPVPESPSIESPSSTATAKLEAADPLAEFTAILHGHEWSYEDSLYPGSYEQPPSPMVFHPNGKFHEKWKWSYWIAAPGVLHVQFWDAVYNPETAVVLNFNEARTAYSGEFKDSKGRLHKLTGTRLGPIR